ncbi:MAG TPA: hypothetical protein VIC29_13790, partial [Steroidobacteraceae bacterium]
MRRPRFSSSAVFGAAVGGQELLLQAADGQHLAAQRDLAGHRDIGSDRNLGEGRNQRRAHADTG